ncbi:hypothetical protein BDZ90DRAFT_765 [Jaminaea rosea]|uniref:Calcium-dependent phosphotriesterase n=1 Tax=Jaminaea rosea TaxID=1569628 RepID=A0A316UYP2_9BASI|nr:hypothetical protein BDZ90DRAFT_765 [Jaminaea rosea]PWN29908.1 hypothetical protein BDZ90DRAFT_765 [Jaminaea rosea]
MPSKRQVISPGQTRGEAPPPSPQGRRAPQSLVSNRIKLALLALILSRLIPFLSWATTAFWPVSLPDFWVPDGSTCSNLNASQVDDSVYDGKPTGGIASTKQELSFCEDAEHLVGGWVLFSCDFNRGRWNTVMGPLEDPEPRGSLWIWDARNGSEEEEEGPRVLSLSGYPKERDFHPLGTAYHEGSGRLFVVNHARDASSIEVFDLVHDRVNGAWEAHYVLSLRHPLATHTPNAIVALGATSLLVTNDHLLARRPPRDIEQLQATYRALSPDWLPSSLIAPLARLASNPLVANLAPRLETILGLGGGWVAQLRFTDDEASAAEARLVATGIPFANGLAISPDGSTLAVASTTTPGVRMYAFTAPPSGDGWAEPLGRRRGVSYDVVSTPFAPDNVAFSRTSRSPKGKESDKTPWGGAKLVVAGHANPIQLLSLARGPYDLDNEGKKQKKASSWVVAIDVVAAIEGGESEQEEDDQAPHPALRAGMARERLVAVHPPHSSSPTSSWEYRLRTLYQGSAGSANGPGVRSSTTGLLIDEEDNPAESEAEGKATFVVPGLYARGVMVCHGVSL